jgi:hypothetical protein
MTRQMRMTVGISPEENAAIDRIIDRSSRLLVSAGRKPTPHETRRLIEMVHSRNPLRLDAMAAARDFDLLHDVCGIGLHADPITGELRNHFDPRFSSPSASA